MDGVNWDDFRLVKAIADSRSLVGAAEALGLNHSTIFRRLGALEETIGARLFERSRTGYAATAAGEEMIALAGRMDQDVSDFERRIAGRDEKPSGQLRVTTNDSFFVYLLAPVLASFRKAYPDITLDLIVANQALNLSKRDADVAVRATYAPPETLVGRRIGSLGWGRYVARALLTPDFDVNDPNHDYIGFSEQFGGAEAFEWFEKNVAPARVVMRTNTPLGVSESIAAGMGLGVLPRFIGDQNPNIAFIDTPLPNSEASLWLLTHPDLRHSARVRAFMDHAGAALSKMKGLLSGDGGKQA